MLLQKQAPKWQDCRGGIYSELMSLVAKKSSQQLTLSNFAGRSTPRTVSTQTFALVCPYPPAYTDNTSQLLLAAG